MKTFHSVVLRCAVQYLFGHESAAYNGVVSRGIIYSQTRHEVSVFLEGASGLCMNRTF